MSPVSIQPLWPSSRGAPTSQRRVFWPGRLPRHVPLPADVYWIRRDVPISAHQLHFLGERLGNEQPIEWVGVMQGQLSYGEDMLQLHCKNL